MQIKIKIIWFAYQVVKDFCWLAFFVLLSFIFIFKVISESKKHILESGTGTIEQSVVPSVL